MKTWKQKIKKVIAPLKSRYRKKKITFFDETQDEQQSNDDIEEITFFDETQDEQQSKNDDTEDMDTSEAKNLENEHKIENTDTINYMNLTKTDTPENYDQTYKKVNQDRHHMNDFKNSHTPEDYKQTYKKQYFTAAIKMLTVGLEVNVAARLR